jgi:carbon storage regulator
MLVLSRRRGEIIRIGPDITITITDVTGGKCRVGIDCPKEIPVWREELTKGKESANVGRTS